LVDVRHGSGVTLRPVPGGAPIQLTDKFSSSLCLGGRFFA
jgi:hypothetical protein